jgi:hypothetical protein
MNEKQNIDEYDYSQYITDDPDVRNLVEGHLKKELGDIDFNELITKPTVTMSESTFIRYVVAYYKDPSEDRRAILLGVIKNPRAQIRVVDDAEHKELFIMPPLLAEIDTRVKAMNHTQLSSIERLIAHARNIRERSGVIGDIALAKEAFGRNIIKVKDDGSDKVIANILKRYGLCNPSEEVNDSLKRGKVYGPNPTTNSNDEGYIDEW